MPPEFPRPGLRERLPLRVLAEIRCSRDLDLLGNCLCDLVGVGVRLFLGGLGSTGLLGVLSRVTSILRCSSGITSVFLTASLSSSLALSASGDFGGDFAGETDESEEL